MGAGFRGCFGIELPVRFSNGATSGPKVMKTRLGTLEPGKDADFLLLTGPPLHYRTLVDQTYINGHLYYDRAKEPLLLNARKLSHPTNISALFK